MFDGPVGTTTDIQMRLYKLKKKKNSKSTDIFHELTIFPHLYSHPVLHHMTWISLVLWQAGYPGH